MAQKVVKWVPNNKKKTYHNTNRRKATSDLYRLIDQSSKIKKSKKIPTRMRVYTVGNMAIINVSMLWLVCFINYDVYYYVKH